MLTRRMFLGLLACTVLAGCQVLHGGLTGEGDPWRDYKMERAMQKADEEEGAARKAAVAPEPEEWERQVDEAVKRTHEKFEQEHAEEIKRLVPTEEELRRITPQ